MPTGRLKWDNTGEHIFETGVDHGVLYVIDDTAAADNDHGKYGKGVVWNGLITVSENPSGAEPTALWSDNIKYLNLMSAEDFACTIEAYTYPDEFMQCDGSEVITDGVYVHQQKRKMFGFTYRTRIGNDEVGDDLGYKIHLVYGCLASPSERSYATVNDSPEAITFSWEVNTTPIDLGTIGGVSLRPAAYIEIDSREFADDTVSNGVTTIGTKHQKLINFENYLYGQDADSTVDPAVVATDAYLPLPSKVYDLLHS